MKFFHRRSNAPIASKETKPTTTSAAAAASAARGTKFVSTANTVSLSKSNNVSSPTGSSSSPRTTTSPSSTSTSTSTTGFHRTPPAATTSPSRSSNSNKNANNANNVSSNKIGKISKSIKGFASKSANTTNVMIPHATNMGSNPFGNKSNNRQPGYKQKKSLKRILIELDDDDFLEEELDVDDTCHQIVQWLHDVDVDTDDVTNACRALHLLALADDSDLDGPSAATGPGVDALMEVMEVYGDDPRIQQQACIALEALAAWDENQRRIVVGRSGVGTVLKALEDYGLGGRPRSGDPRRDNNGGGDPKVSSACLGILCHLSRDYGEELTDAVPPILRLLRKERDNGPIYRRLSRTLANITNGESDKSRSSQLLLSKLQGIPVALKALNNPQFANDLELKLFSVQILEHVASHPAVDVKGKIVMQGGIDRIVECLQRNTVAEAHARTAITAAATTPYGSGSRRSSATTNPFDEEDVQDDVPHQQQHHTPSMNANDTEARTKRTITESAIQTLANLADGSADETKRQIGKALGVLLKVVRQHPHTPSIQCRSFDVLRNLAPLNCETILALGAVSTVLTAMLQHPEETMLQYHACATLTNLFVASRQAGGSSSSSISSSISSGNGSSNGNNDNNNSSNSKRINLNYDLVHSLATEDGLSIIFQTVRLHQANLQVQEQAFGTLFFLSCSQDYLTPQQREQLCLEENIFVILGTLNQYIDQSELLCQRGCGLILNLSFVAPTTQDVVVSVGGIKILLACMRRHGLNLDVQTFAAGCLAGICLDPNHHAEFVSEEGISTVLAAMLIHPGHPAIQAYGCEALSNVATSSRDYKETIVNGNARAVATDALSKHKMHRGVQNRVALLLQALS